VNRRCQRRPRRVPVAPVGIAALFAASVSTSADCSFVITLIEWRDALALRKPLAADFREQSGRFRLVHQDGACRPAIGESQAVQVVEQARRGDARESGDGEDAQMCGAEARFEPAGQRLVGEQRVEIDRGLRHTDAVPFGRDGRMKIGQRLGVGEPAALGHEAVEERQHPIGAIDEAAHQLPGIDAGGLAALVEPAFGAGGGSGRRPPQEGQVVVGDK